MIALDPSVQCVSWATLVLGLGFWTFFDLATPAREPRDHPLYRVVGYPAALVLSGTVGSRFPRYHFRFLPPLVFFEAQMLGQMLRNNEISNLWLLGLAMFAVISSPGMLVMGVASFLGLRRKGAEFGD